MDGDEADKIIFAGPKAAIKMMSVEVREEEEEKEEKKKKKIHSTPLSYFTQQTI